MVVLKQIVQNASSNVSESDYADVNARIIFHDIGFYGAMSKQIQTHVKKNDTNQVRIISLSVLIKQFHHLPSAEAWLRQVFEWSVHRLK